jgi:hypothetical protein
MKTNRLVCFHDELLKGKEIQVGRKAKTVGMWHNSLPRFNVLPPAIVNYVNLMYAIENK